MAQVKKPQIREAILASAMRLFSRQGYSGTTLSEIARGAGVSTATLYVYFKSKLEMVYAIYDPWVRSRLRSVEEKMARMRTPAQKVRLLLETLWRDMPAEKHGFVLNIVQAIASATPRDHYKPTLIHWMEEALERMLRNAVPPGRRAAISRGRYAHVLIMAFDGFILYKRTHPAERLDRAVVDAMAAAILGRTYP